MKILSKQKFLLASIIISLFSVISLIKRGLPPTHDGEFHVLRFEQFFKSINQGTLYPRWAEDFNNGFGIPLFNYVYPLPNFVASFTHLLGFSFIESFKLNMILATLTGSIFFYLWTKKYWGNWGALVSSVFYAFSPYHLLDIYVRGSVGEVWSLGLAPALLWSYLSFYESKKIKYFVLSSVFLSLIIFAHNILAVVFFIFFIAYSSFSILTKKQRSKNKTREILDTLLILGLGIGLSAIFWLPAILETKYVRGLQIFDPTQHFPEFYKLIYSAWGYGFSGRNVIDQMSFQIGLANILIILLCLISLMITKKKKTVQFLIILFFITLFLITPLSGFIWKNFTFMSYVQFPWRFLSILILISSFLAGYLVSEKFFTGNEFKKKAVSIFLIFLSVSLSINYIKAPFHHIRDDKYYLSRDNFTRGTNSPGDVFNTSGFNSSLKYPSARITSRDFEIKTILSLVTKEKVSIKGDTDGKILVNIAYFPGWKAFVDGAHVPVRITKDGLFELDAPKGTHELEVILKSTNLQKISLLISIFSVLFLFCLFMWDKYIKIKK